MNPIKTIDNRDDRREIWTLLARLRPLARYRYLAWACGRVPVAEGNKPRPSWTRMKGRIEAAERRDPVADLELTNEVYADLAHLVLQYRLDPVAAAVELERLVRRSPATWIPLAGPTVLPATAAWTARTPCSGG